MEKADETPFLIVTLVAAFASQASAQSACLPHEKMTDLLDGRYSEQRIAAGLETGGRLIEVFATADRRTWTLVMSTADGASCVVAAGLEWQDVEPKGDGT